MRSDFTPLDVEQYMMELVNRARLDPFAEAVRQGIDLNQGIAPGAISGDTKQALAFDTDLIEAAFGHSQWMVDSDVFSHTGAGGTNPGQRIVASGYAPANTFGWGENISQGGTTGTYDLTEFVKARHDRLFLSTTGHRENLMSEGWREAGFGIAEGVFQGYNSVLATQKFAVHGSERFLTGVRFNDNDSDNFYTPGEGSDAVLVEYAASGTNSFQAVESYSSGGYNAGVSSGDWTVRFSGGALASDKEVTVTIVDENAKIDLISNNWIHTSADITLGVGADRLVLLGRDDLSATGSSVRDKIFGNKGDNLINGEAGDDLISGGRGNDTINGGDGFDDLRGGTGSDTLNANAGGGWMAGDAGNDTLNGGSGRDRAWGGAGNDTFNGGGDNDRARGNEGVDTLNGDGGADLLLGGDDGDFLNGGAGRDYLYGENGNDTLNGGADDDVLNGGIGSDSFVFSNSGADFGRDKVRGFEDGTDILDFSNISSVTSLADLEISDTAWGATKVKVDALNLVYIENTLATDIDESDFVFV